MPLVDEAGWSAGRVSAARSQPYYLDVTHPKANKGVVGMFSRLCNVPPNESATIGDMPNDVLMFKKSGVSIAMETPAPRCRIGDVRHRYKRE
jgi:hydroxymethylpyrimidine pyrophosphatase-like HAD family hydrolase